MMKNNLYLGGPTTFEKIWGDQIWGYHSMNVNWGPLGVPAIFGGSSNPIAYHESSGEKFRFHRYFLVIKELGQLKSKSNK